MKQLIQFANQKKNIKQTDICEKNSMKRKTENKINLLTDPIIS